MQEEMYTPIVVYRGRVTKVVVSLGINVSSDTITAQIRSEAKSTSQLIAAWHVSFLTDGTDGKLVLSLDDSENELGSRTTGFMDLKRVSSGEPIPVFDRPIPVVITETVTA